MNKARRKQIASAISRITDLLQDILYDEMDAFNNMPESLQGSQRGINSEMAQENLEEAISCLEEAVNYLEEIE